MTNPHVPRSVLATITTSLLALLATATATEAALPSLSGGSLQELCASLPSAITARELTSWRAWIQTPPAAILFTILSLTTLALLAWPKSPLRRAIAAGLNTIREHKRLYITTLTIFGILFTLGVITGTRMPDECRAPILDTLTTAVNNTGATNAYANNTPTAATVTFTQNFLVVSTTTLAGSGLILGAPAYLIGTLSFYTQGIPFGLIGNQPPAQLAFVITLLLLELAAYFTVIAGAGMLLATVLKEGLEKYLLGIKKLGLMLTLAGVTLMIGAWYEPLMLAILK